MKWLLFTLIVTMSFLNAQEDPEIKLIMERERLKRQIAASPYTKFVEANRTYIGSLLAYVKMNNELLHRDEVIGNAKGQVDHEVESSKELFSKMVLELEEARNTEGAEEKIAEIEKQLTKLMETKFSQETKLKKLVSDEDERNKALKKSLSEIEDGQKKLKAMISEVKPKAMAAKESTEAHQKRLEEVMKLLKAEQEQ